MAWSCEGFHEQFARTNTTTSPFLETLTYKRITNMTFPIGEKHGCLFFHEKR